MLLLSWLDAVKSRMALRMGGLASRSDRRPRQGRHTPAPLAAAVEVLEDRALLSSLTLEVTTTADSGDGSLRQAILEANANPGLDTITFSIGAEHAVEGTYTIALASALPEITDAVVIDATTQAGYDGAPIVVLNGSSAGSTASGLVISAGDSTVRGLVINDFGWHGIEIHTGGGNLIEGNFIGTNAGGSAAAGNGFNGILVLNSPGNDIRGNLISGNQQHGVELFGSGSVGNVVQGNRIGTDATGENAVANGTVSWHAGVTIRNGASGNLVGGSTQGAPEQVRNVISGNAAHGVVILGAGTDANVVAGNYIGTTADGSARLGNAGNGLHVSGGAQSNVIGTNGDGVDDEFEGNVISANGGSGILLLNAGTDHNVVAGNFIGTDATGTAGLGNANHGIVLHAEPQFNRIGTNGNGVSDEAERNVISANGVHGIALQEGSDGNVVAGNYIGTDVTGNQPLGNGNFGVRIGGARFNRIGVGDGGVVSESQRNVISGNGQHGIVITGAGTDQNIVAGNFIGVGATGSGTGLGNNGDGIRILAGAQSNLVGADGDALAHEAARNVISGNAAHGVLISGAGTNFNIVAGNVIGLDADGNAPLGNGAVGIAMTGGVRANVIGVHASAAVPDLLRNVISGNEGWAAVFLNNAHDNVIAGNHIGTDATGTAARGVNGHGVELVNGSSGNVIGVVGAGVNAPAQRNVISGNPWWGVVIRGAGTDNNTVSGNYIGTDSTGTYALGNGSELWHAGVLIGEGASRNLIGGTGANAGEHTRNVISGNRRGVTIEGLGTNENIVAGNFIGTDATGTSPLGNDNLGILIAGGARLNLIGTDGDGVGDAAERNVISGNLAAGIQIGGTGTDENVVAGNFIGTDASGIATLANGAHGVLLSGGARSNVIGVHSDAANPEALRNVVSGNAIHGVVIRDAGTEDNVVAGNAIGTDLSGTLRLGNTHQGVRIQTSARNLIGGTAPGAANVIGDNRSSGIALVAGAFENWIEGNLIGVRPDGVTPLGNRAEAGVLVIDASANHVGGTAPGAGNVISGNDTFAGIWIRGAAATGNIVQGNHVGVDGEGVTAVGGQSHGVLISNGARANLIGNSPQAPSAEGGRNVISGNVVHAVALTGAGTDENVVAGNYIGTDATGMLPLGNGSQPWHAAVLINAGASRNLIGGTGADAGEHARNVISGNARGITIEGAGTNENIVAGNFIGTDATGAAPLGNDTLGILITGGARLNRIGTDGDGVGDEAERNLISGNMVSGVQILGAGTDENVVAGNYIGTDLTGMLALGNGSNSSGAGVWILGGAQSNVIGTIGDGRAGNAAEGNLISGNQGWAGVFIEGIGTENNVVAGNLIGTNSAGTAPLTTTGRNNGDGIEIKWGASFNRVGTNGNGIADSLERNVISGNTGQGIVIWSRVNEGVPEVAAHNVVAGNFIGTDADGTGAAGNGGHGVLIMLGAQSNRIGDVEAGAGNVIAFNGRAGVVLRHDDTTGNSIRGNSIHSNAGLGIDLGDDGVTPNDPFDEDTGPNNLQNFPELTAALAGETTLVLGTLHSTPDAQFTLDFYANAVPHPSGHGEGKHWLGAVTVTTDAAGNASFQVDFDASGAPGPWITATATNAAGSTSEFSEAVEAAGAFEQIIAWSNPVSILHGTALSGEQLNAVVEVTGGPGPAGELTYAWEGQVIGEGTILPVGRQTLVVTAAATDLYQEATAEVTLDVLKPFSISGFVWSDFNNDGEINFGERVIEGVTLVLTGVDDLEAPVNRTAFTDADGIYRFEDLRPGAYMLTQVQPEGYEQGRNSLGTLAGNPWGEDVSQEALDRFFIEFPFDALEHVVLDPDGVTDAINYNFGNRPGAEGEVGEGQTAALGFWNNRHGQDLIRSLNGGADATQLGDWLAATFVNLFGSEAGMNNLAGQTNAQIAEFVQTLFGLRGPKVEFQVLATALAVYVTNDALAGDTGEAFGFSVTENGVGTRTYNVGDSGAAFDVEDGTELTVLDLLLATDRLSRHGILYFHEDESVTRLLRSMANEVYGAVNDLGL